MLRRHQESGAKVELDKAKVLGHLVPVAAASISLLQSAEFCRPRGRWRSSAALRSRRRMRRSPPRMLPPPLNSKRPPGRWAARGAPRAALRRRRPWSCSWPKSTGRNRRTGRPQPYAELRELRQQRWCMLGARAGVIDTGSLRPHPPESRLHCKLHAWATFWSGIDISESEACWTCS